MHLTMEYNLIPIKIPDRLCLYKGGILKFIWKRKTGMLREFLEGRRKLKKPLYPVLKAFINKNAMGRDGYIDSQSRRGSPETEPHRYAK